MRATIQISTYDKVRELFEQNKGKEYSRTSIRDELRIDYESLKMILERLLKEKFIVQTGNRFRLK